MDGQIGTPPIGTLPVRVKMKEGVGVVFLLVRGRVTHQAACGRTLSRAA